MKQEKAILSFLMVVIGLVVAGIAFYFYQSSKTITPSKNVSETITPTAAPTPSFFLVVNQPQDETISDRKLVTVSGKTDPSATVVIMTTSDQEVIQPSSVGNFTTTLNIDEGANYIKIQAILPSGETLTEQRVVSYTTTQF